MLTWIAGSAAVQAAADDDCFVEQTAITAVSLRVTAW